MFYFWNKKQILAFCIMMILSTCTELGLSSKKSNNNALLAGLFVLSQQIPDVTNIEFTEIGIASTAEEKISIRTTPKAKVTFANGEVKEYPLEYKTLYRSGDKDSAGTEVGKIKTAAGADLVFSDGSSTASAQPDANTLFYKGGKYYLLTHFEGYPGAMYSAELTKNSDGTFKVNKYSNVDFSSKAGTVFNCAATLSPWGTHLGGEEDYNFDGYVFGNFDIASASNIVAGGTANVGKCNANGTAIATNVSPAWSGYSDPFTCPALFNMKTYQGVANFTDLNPYKYGKIVEIEYSDAGAPKITKRHVLGKFTPELASVMTDNKTVYMSDDGDYAGLYMFIADKEKDLSAGTMYMAKWIQTDATAAGKANIRWIKLASGNDAEIETIINKNINTTDIWDYASTTSCPATHKLLRAGFTSQNSCIRLRDGSNGSTLSSKFSSASEVQKAAAFLETRRYGSFLGATTEFSKEEGIAYNADKNVLYIAMSRIERGMRDTSTDPANDVKLTENLCGAVYELKLGGSQTDLSGGAINSSFVGTEMFGITKLTGTKLNVGEEFASENFCSPKGIANPDGINYLKGILFVGEDTDRHYNNMVWAYDTKKDTLTRIMTLPVGGENTGGFSPFEQDGRTYLFANIQHPLQDKPRDANGTTLVTGVDTASADQKRGYVGYIHGLPILKLNSPNNPIK
ncbi:MAG: DUF839 domain-containing protein [Leptospiraceae bacterium]|nr:DUF839 domain-containing protein [Leptospiraceae bacterium]